MPLPSDFGSIKSIWLDTDPIQKLTQVSIDQLRSIVPFATTGRPRYYALAGAEIIFGPSPDDAYSVNMVYQRKLAPLTATNTTNWLLEQHPDLYLYGALVEAEARGWSDDRAAMINGKVEGIIAEINRAGNMKRTSGGIRMNARARWGI